MDSWIEIGGTPVGCFQPSGESFPREPNDTAPSTVTECMLVACPQCGCEYTHQETTHVYSREEDEPHIRTSVHAVSGIAVQGEESDTDSAGNPSRNRNGIRIEASCEQCPGAFSIEILQHKGQTFIQLVSEAHRTREGESTGEQRLDRALNDGELEELAQRIEAQVTPRLEWSLITAHRASERRSTIKQRRALEEIAQLQQNDLVRLGVRLQRLAPQCKSIAERPVPFAWLARPEMKALFDVAAAVRRARQTQHKGAAATAPAGRAKKPKKDPGPMTHGQRAGIKDMAKLLGWSAEQAYDECIKAADGAHHSTNQGLVARNGTCVEDLNATGADRLFRWLRRQGNFSATETTHGRPAWNGEGEALGEEEISEIAKQLRTAGVGQTAPEVLAKNHDGGGPQGPSWRQRAALLGMSGLCAGDLVRLGVALGRLAPQCSAFANAMDPLWCLKRREVGGLFAISQTIAHAPKGRGY